MRNIPRTIFCRVAVATALLVVSTASCMHDSLKDEPGRELILVASPEASVKAPVTGETFPQSRSLLLSSRITGGETWFTAVPFTYDSGSGAWRGQPAKFWPLTGTLDFLSVSAGSYDTAVAWNADPASGAELTVGDNSTVQEDILFASRQGAALPGNVPLLYSHALALLQMSVSADVAYDAATNTGITVSSIELLPAWWGGRVVATAASNAVTYAWSDLSSRKERSVLEGASFGVPASATDVGAAVMLPPQAAPGFTVNYTQHNGYDASGGEVNLPLSFTHIPTEGYLLSGQRWTWGIHFTLDHVTVNGSIEPWHEVSQEVSMALFSTVGTTVTPKTADGEWQ